MQDKHFYSVDIATLGETIAQYKMIIQGLHILVVLYIGFLYDNVNTRLLLTLGGSLLTASVFALPYGHNIYPGLFLITLAMTSGLSISNAPLLVDYVAAPSKGLAASYYSIFGSLGGIVASFGLMQVVQSFGLLVGTFAIGGVVLLCALYLICFVRNTLTLRPAPSSPRPNYCTRVLRSIPGACRFSC